MNHFHPEIQTQSGCHDVHQGLVNLFKYLNVDFFISGDNNWAGFQDIPGIIEFQCFGTRSWPKNFMNGIPVKPKKY